MAAMQAHEQHLLRYALELAEQMPALTLIGAAADKIGILSFTIDGAHPADIGFLLDKQGIAIRTGEHCAQPLMRRLNVSGTARASFSIYNTEQEVERLFAGLKKAHTMLL